MKLPGKKILLGVTGSIAAYKTAELIRIFIKEGAEVQVIMTKPAHDFITPLTLSTLSGKPVLTEFSAPGSGVWNNHVELGLWADVFLIAPVSAHTLAKLANGYCGDLLSATYLSARCPVYLAPAMDLDMFAHPLVKENLAKLAAAGTGIIGPDSGFLASGLEGEGRMTEPGEIAAYIIKELRPYEALAGKKVLVTAGPTREPIDPVRFISNHASGKMGVALAREFAQRGCEVTLVAGPGVKTPSQRNIHTVQVETAADMFSACMQYFPGSDVTIMAAAVADYQSAETASGKLKKSGGEISIRLIPTRDILAEMGQRKTNRQLLVGFALETDNEMENAVSKLDRKNLDMIVLNSMRDQGAGFNTDTNKITIIEKNKEVTPYPLKSKNEVASDIADKIISTLTKG